MKKCEAIECNEKHYCRGYCRKHYKRLFYGRPIDGPMKYEIGIHERLKSKIVENKSTGCHEWTGCTTGGYGQIEHNGKLDYTHRIAWKLLHGEIPDGLHVLHKCDNRKCVNPKHLFLGTHQDNIRDMIEKNRQARGSKCGSAILHENDISQIRKRFANGNSNKLIGIYFGVAPKTISNIKTGVTWKHV
jgi:hypothetical protein